MSKILIIDDYDESVALIKTYFIGTSHSFVSANNGIDGIKVATNENPDIILLDVIMPGMDGFEVCQKLKDTPQTSHIPIIMVTGLEDNRSRARCYELGVDYITKPFNIYDIKTRVNTLLQLNSFQKQLASAEKLIMHLALVAETKDSYEQGTIKKIASYGMHFAEKLGMEEEQIRSIGKGGLLHAVGKIEIDDKILTKPGPLTEDEFKKVQNYPAAGEKLCSCIESLRDALPIIRNHKENFDGSGYPDKLEGENIPVMARIVAMVDGFNALTTDRPYRKAMDLDDAFEALSKQVKIKKIDPVLFKEFRKVFKRNRFPQVNPHLVDNLMN